MGDITALETPGLIVKAAVDAFGGVDILVNNGKGGGLGCGGAWCVD